MGKEQEPKNDGTDSQVKEEDNYPEINTTGTHPKVPIHEFMVDLLGGLVPGALFMIGASIALFPAFFIVFSLTQMTGLDSGVFSLNQINSFAPVSLSGTIKGFLSAVKNTPNMLWIGIFSFTIAIAYVLGHLFYRNGPKEPDRKSFSRHAKRLIDKEKNYNKFVRWLRSQFFKYDFENYEKELKQNLACTCEENCEFPYPYLRDYLGHRGLCHLCPFVVWKDEGESSYRSKNYINLLKIRLKYYFPEKCSIIIRNEAHVRLASSSWYVAKALQICSVVGIVIALPVILYHHGTAVNYAAPLVYPILIFIGAAYIKTRVEQFIHYQRIREVIYVLETAYTAFAKRSWVLKSPFKEYDYNFTGENCKRKNCGK